METLVIFSANVDSIDSWDLENLKYLRKLSKGTLASCGGDPASFETLSYKSGSSGSGGSANNSADNDPTDDTELVKECDELLDRALSFSRRRNVFRDTNITANNGRKPVHFGENFKLRKSNDPIRDSRSYTFNNGTAAQENRFKKDIMFPQNGNGSKYESSTDSLIHVPSLTTKNGTREPSLHGRTSIGRISVPPAVALSGSTKTVAGMDGLSSMVLDNCYVMDVLMVRNDSVLTKDTGSSSAEFTETVGKNLLSKRELEKFRASASSPSSLCSDDSFTSAIAKGFFDMENGSSCSERSSTSIQKRLMINPELHPLQDTSQTQQNLNSVRNPKLCPHCGSCGGVDKTKISHSSRRTHFRRDSLDLINGPSLVGGNLAAPRTSSPIPMDIPKSPSPYYLRIRKDLPSSSSSNTTTSYTLRSTPSNFSLDKQGQLVIDYSSNWVGLESYVKRLATGR